MAIEALTTSGGRRKRIRIRRNAIIPSLSPFLFYHLSLVISCFVLSLSCLPLDVVAQRDEEDYGYTRGRTVLTILYLCVLGMCFVVPVFYYFRLHCCEDDDNNNDNPRGSLHGVDGPVDISLGSVVGIIGYNSDGTPVMNDPFTGGSGMLQDLNAEHLLRASTEEARAARKKYIVERRARILQLFAPVRMTLAEENFPRLRKSDDINISSSSIKGSNSKDSNDDVPVVLRDEIKNGSITSFVTCIDEEHSERYEDKNDMDNDNDSINNNNNNNNNNKNEENPPKKNSNNNNSTTATKNNTNSSSTLVRTPSVASIASFGSDNPYDLEESLVIEIPVPGLQQHQLVCNNSNSSSCNNTKNNKQPIQHRQKMRLAPGMCTICLSGYEVGSTVVWSSNSMCEHVFHEQCIEQWLMKQREGPLCPCCRRDFIVDPYDLDDNDDEKIANSNNNNDVTTTISETV